MNDVKENMFNELENSLKTLYILTLQHLQIGLVLSVNKMDDMLEINFLSGLHSRVNMMILFYGPC